MRIFYFNFLYESFKLVSLASYILKSFLRYVCHLVWDLPQLVWDLKALLLLLLLYYVLREHCGK